MKRKLVTVIAAALMALSIAAGAGAAPGNNWGQEVSGCNHSDCYPGGTSRGGYVSGQARDSQTPGYGWEIHNLAHPGNSNPGPFQ